MKRIVVIGGCRFQGGDAFFRHAAAEDLTLSVNLINMTQRIQVPQELGVSFLGHDGERFGNVIFWRKHGNESNVFATIGKFTVFPTRHYHATTTIHIHVGWAGNL